MGAMSVDDSTKLAVLNEMLGRLRKRAETFSSDHCAIEADCLEWAIGAAKNDIQVMNFINRRKNIETLALCVGCGKHEQDCDCHQFDPETK